MGAALPSGALGLEGLVASMSVARCVRSTAPVVLAFAGWIAPRSRIPALCARPDAIVAGIAKLLEKINK